MALLTDFAASIQRRGRTVHGVAVSQHGRLLEEWRTIPDEPHVLHSLSKSFTATAVGMATDAGLFTLEDRIVDLLPESIPAEPCGYLRHLTVRNLMTMQPGRDQPCMMMSQRSKIIHPDWVKYYLSQPFDREPGERFAYDTGCTYILSAVVQKFTGETVLDYLTPRLFTPLGIEKPCWEACPMGRTLGGAGLFLRTKELLPFGELYLRHGEFGGRQLVSADFADAATEKQADTPPGGPKDSVCGYGYQFWMNHDGSFRADGAYGQFCIVLRELDAVIAITSDDTDAQQILDCVWEDILPKLA